MIGAGAWFGIARMHGLQQSLAAEVSRSEALTVKLTTELKHSAQQRAAIDAMRDSLDRVIAERETFRKSFLGFNERLAADPEKAECRINRASAKVANRIAKSTGGFGVDTPIECD